MESLCEGYSQSAVHIDWDEESDHMGKGKRPCEMACTRARTDTAFATCGLRCDRYPAPNTERHTDVPSEDSGTEMTEFIQTCYSVTN